MVMRLLSVFATAKRLASIVPQRKSCHETLRKQMEEFTIEKFRGLPNVSLGKLERFTDLGKHCLKVALEEIKKLCPFYVGFTQIK
jgi:hypothetical protein